LRRRQPRQPAPRHQLCPGRFAALNSRTFAAGQPARAQQPPVAVRALPARPVAGQGRPAQAAGLV